MNRFLKWTLISLGALVGLVALAYGGMFLKVRHETRGFTPLETGPVVDGISVVRDDFANIFLLRDSLAGYVAIDCGISAERVEAQLHELGIAPDEVTAVLLTHTDGDHVGALGLFDHAEIYMARFEEQMIDGRRAKFLWFGNSLPRTDYRLIDDRQVFHVGGLKVEGILAPGHTAGMMAYLIDDKYLFSGDIVSLVEGHIAPIPAFFDMDDDEALASNEILRHLPTARYIFTGHWGWADYRNAVQ